MTIQKLSTAYDQPLADMIRSNLKAHGLDIPGTVYFDEGLDHLSAYYGEDPASRSYLVLEEEGRLIGGVGLARFDAFPDCAEMQKLYLVDGVKGRGLGYFLIEEIEKEARRLGYTSLYLETHTNLQVAMHLYEKAGYHLIERPATVVHSTMNRFYRKEFGRTV